MLDDGLSRSGEIAPSGSGLLQSPQEGGWGKETTTQKAPNALRGGETTRVTATADVVSELPCRPTHTDPAGDKRVNQTSDRCVSTL